jgi:hypothetical protein
MEVTGQIHTPATLPHMPIGGSLSRSGSYRKEKHLYPLPGLELQFLDSPARNPIARLIEIS